MAGQEKEPTTIQKVVVGLLGIGTTAAFVYFLRSGRLDSLVDRSSRDHGPRPLSQRANRIINTSLVVDKASKPSFLIESVVEAVRDSLAENLHASDFDLDRTR